MVDAAGQLGEADVTAQEGQAAAAGSGSGPDEDDGQGGQGQDGSRATSSRGPAQPVFVAKSCEVAEWQVLSLGPFGQGTECEIVRAWYGIPGRQADVTREVCEIWARDHALKLSGFNEMFGDPAPMRMKKMGVEYRIRNHEWEVSRATYSEGVGKIGLLPCMVTKTVTNVVGAAVATGGLAVGKTCAGFQKLTGDDTADVADNPVFQMGWTAWLRLNGIFPSVSYEPVTGGSPAEDMRQTPLLVSNHMCYIETFALPAIFNAPKVLGMKGVSKTPFVGMFAKEIGIIEVDRDCKASREATLQAIQRHVDQWTRGSRPLLMFPEGTTSNGDSILPFRRGAFVPGAPVRPIVLAYTGAWNPANTNFKTSSSGEIEVTGDSEWGYEFLGHMMHSLQVRVLKPYVPSEEEKADPHLYASNVHALMSRAYAELRAEVEAKKREAEQASWQARLNPQNLIDSAVEVTGGLWRGATRQAASSGNRRSPPEAAQWRRTSWSS